MTQLPKPLCAASRLRESWRTGQEAPSPNMNIFRLSAFTLLVLIFAEVTAIGQRFPRIDTFPSPNGSFAIDLHSKDNGWGESDLYVRAIETGKKQKLATFDYPVQGPPVWSTSGKTVLVHTGTLSAGIWAQIFRIEADGSSRLVYELVPPKFWKLAIVKDYLPTGSEPSHVYIRCNYFDDETKSLWCAVSGDVITKDRQVRFTPFVVGLTQRDFAISLAKRLPKPPTEAPPVRMASEGFRGSGTGFFISPEGYVITCAHVVRGASMVKVDTPTSSYNAAIVFQDGALDIAVLKVNVSVPTPCLPIANSRTTALGDPVFTIGFPNPVIQGFNPKFTRGEISSLTGLEDCPSVFQISIPIQTGNSGGPVIADSGSVIGVVNAKLNTLTAAKLTGDFAQNVNFAIKTETFLDRLKQQGIKVSGEHKGLTDSKAAIQAAQKAIVRVSVYGCKVN